jgi:2-C-methyl-D-erythritol 2,4-cyclodiphosphate synthase
MSNLRVGLGFDIHKFNKPGTKKRDLILAGVKIPASFSLDAVSDGDVVVHAVCDALCGCCSLGDIGDYFPPQAHASQGIDSTIIAALVVKKIAKKFKIINIDVTIVAQHPRLAPYKKAMTRKLAQIFPDCAMNIKIKSKEGLNILGGSRAIATLVAALVKKVS